MLRHAFALLVGLHALIHLLGPASAFGWFATSPLRTPISSPGGLSWLAAAILLLVAAIATESGARWWWCPAIAGVVLSQVLIASTSDHLSDPSSYGPS